MKNDSIIYYKIELNNTRKSHKSGVNHKYHVYNYGSTIRYLEKCSNILKLRNQLSFDTYIKLNEKYFYEDILRVLRDINIYLGKKNDYQNYIDIEPILFGFINRNGSVHAGKSTDFYIKASKVRDRNKHLYRQEYLRIKRLGKAGRSAWEREYANLLAFINNEKLMRLLSCKAYFTLDDLQLHFPEPSKAKDFLISLNRSEKLILGTNEKESFSQFLPMEQQVMGKFRKTSSIPDPVCSPYIFN